MAKASAQLLSTHVGHMASQAVTIQRRLDDAHCLSNRRLVAKVRDLRETLRDEDTVVAELAGAIVPPRPTAQSFEMDCRLQLQCERRRGFALKAMPLNMTYDICFGMTAEDGCRIHLDIRQVPSPCGDTEPPPNTDA